MAPSTSKNTAGYFRVQKTVAHRNACKLNGKVACVQKNTIVLSYALSVKCVEIFIGFHTQG